MWVDVGGGTCIPGRMWMGQYIHLQSFPRTLLAHSAAMPLSVIWLCSLNSHKPPLISECTHRHVHPNAHPRGFVEHFN